MTHATETDLSLLTWVKGEIDASLSRASDALRTIKSDAEAAGQTQFAQTHLHQVSGALSIISLDGLAQFTHMAEALLAQMGRGELTIDKQTLALARRSFASISNYLEEIAHGADDQALRLFPLYAELAQARGLPPPDPAELFHPDLSRRPPPRSTAPQPLDAKLREQAQRHARTHYSQGLFSLLRGKASQGARTMREAVGMIESLQTQAGQRTLWWIAQAFFDGLSEGPEAVSGSVKRLCTRIEAHLRQQTGTSLPPPQPERLLRDLLYQVAIAPANTPQQRLVQEHWGLERLIPPAGSSVSDVPLEPLLNSLQQALAAVHRQWDEFTAGTAIALPRYDELLTTLVAATKALGRPTTDALLASLKALAGWLRADPLRFDDTMALEAATGLLLLESDFSRRIVDAGLATQMRSRAKRIMALAQGKPLPADNERQPDSAARANEERQALTQLCSEMRLSLAQVEQTLDDFFRNPAKHAALAQLEQPLQQLVGMLSVLGEQEAVDLVTRVKAQISQLVEAPQEQDSTVFEDLAHQLSALGFFLEALPHSRVELARFLTPLRTLAGASAAEAEATLPPSFEPLTTDIQPGSETTSELPAAADHDRDPDFAQAFITQLDPLEVQDLELESEFEPPPAISPSAPLPDSDEAIDAELLEIFIEEAHEVLATIAQHLSLVSSEPEDSEHLITVRRGFHTLKGSGRMVGLSELGETAWGMEQTLNRWLQLEWPPSAELLSLVKTAHGLFTQWVVALEQGQEVQLDTDTLLAEAARLGKLDSLPADDLEVPETRLELELEPEPEPEQARLAEDSLLADAMPADTSTEQAPGAAALIEEAPLEETSLEDVASSAVEPEASLPEETPRPDVSPADDATVDEAPTLSTESGTDASPDPNEEAMPTPAAPAPLETVLIGEQTLSAKLLSLYQNEAVNHLGTLTQELELLATQAARKPSDAAIRAAHTLAGTSATAQLQPPHELSRALEHALARLRNRGEGIHSAELSLLQEAVNALQSMQVEISALQAPTPAPALIAALADCPGSHPENHLKAAGADSTKAAEAVSPAQPSATLPVDSTPPQDEVDPQLLPIFLEEAAEQLNQLYATLRTWSAEPALEQHPQAAARLLHSLKGSARMAGAMTVGSHFHLLESRLIEAQRDGTAVATLVEELNAGLDQIEQLIDRLAGAGSTEPEPASDHASPLPSAEAKPASGTESDSSSASSLRVRAELVDRFVNQAGEIGIARTRVEGELRGLRRALLDLTENVIRLRQQLREIELQGEVQMQSRIARTEAEESGFDPLEMDRYTRLQELTRMMAESVNDVTTVQQVLLHNLDSAESALNAQGRMNRELQQNLMNVRMLPFDSLAERLYRVVRQSARDEGKRATLDIHDGDIELDRSILEQMAAPLEHLLRNAIAHGIEPAADRLAAGKVENGQISLSVRQEGNEVAIELSDDGRGLNLERIAARAREKGLLSPEIEQDPRQLANLIFHPGFTTATAVSSIAGRGVGMDVVKSQTAALGGRIELDSDPGSGTRILIHLPLTLAITQALLVEAEERRWALPANMIAQAQELKTEAMNQVRSAQGIEWEEEFYPYRYLPELLGNAHAHPQEQRYHWLLLLRAGSQRLALHVDSIVGNQEIVIKNAGPQLTRMIGFGSATVLSDGEITLIINPIALAERQAAPNPAELGTAIIAAQQTLQPCVMVVDDSLTVRRITGRLLEREGYRVLTAKDGVDALEQLTGELPDIILSDIEMPRMDGFDLLRNIRADQRTQSLPVIMITSRLADKHRNLAFELGANHYLGKPYQEEELLALITQHVQARAAPV